ncbi:NAD(P)H-dependent oxidoreductase [Sphingobacterium daejeonense]|uniref:NAD(P)H-dependent oxidoreductase n=1 Tax=Sphingobacterium daejeonense TaxID=371142 RepID=UPI0021A6CBF3|nr:NAD(P)H-dependent oxidoreductase [Sphingobacterium daejeonense]MCT1532725.1 NAD(P)H-dependent oxidoreductase [Sphingobacterium daejeonense]
MKTLIVVIHPDFNNSVINKKWVESLQKYPDKFYIHLLHQVYPNENIDIKAEQKLVEKYEKIVFQFPFYWFNCPPLFKKWLDNVLTYNWAYGSKSGYQLEGKKIALAISVGIEENEFGSTERYKYSLEELLRPFELTFEYIKADYRPFFAYYGIELNSSKEWVEKSIVPYLEFLNKL